MDGTDSSYSALEIHICWKVDKEARIEPPIHTEYFLSGGATTLIFMVDGARAVSSLVILSAIPGNMVVPPDMTILAYRSLRMSMSHFMMVWKVQSWMPDASLPMREGWKRTSGHRNLSLPITITLPSVAFKVNRVMNEGENLMDMELNSRILLISATQCRRIYSHICYCDFRTHT